MAITVKYGEPKKLASLQSIFVSFPYKQSIVDIIRTIPERYWHSSDKVWELDYRVLSELKKRLPYEDFNIIGKPMDDSKYGEKLIKKVYELPNELKTKLYSYQEEDYNELMNFDKYLLLNEQGTGKAQPLYSKLLTPNGYINMGDVKVGDEVFGEDGKPHKVIGVYPQGKKPIYEITFSDRTTCRCSDEHLWEVHTKKTSYILTLSEIMGRGLYRSYYHSKHDRYFKDWRFYIPIVKPLNFETKDVNIDPWLLGVLLGDGCFTVRGCVTFTNTEKDIIDRVKEIVTNDGMKFSNHGYGRYGIVKKEGKYNKYYKYLNEYGLGGCNSFTKFIPDVYKYNSKEVRLELLRGLFSTDGCVEKTVLTYTTISKQLMLDIVFLVQSLGGTCSYSQETYVVKKTDDIRIRYKLIIKLSDGRELLTTEKHTGRYKINQHTSPYRTIRNIEYIGEEECQCIMVDNPSHLYLTDNMIVTHNTVTSIAVALKRKELGQVKHCLIVCGVNGLKYNWQNEIKQHTGMDALILGNRKNKKGIWNTGSTQDKLEDLDNLTEFFVVTNIESLRSKELKDKLKLLFDKHIIDMCVCDEIHKAKSSSSQQGKALLLLAKHIKYFYGLTGTVLKNSPLDAYVPLKCTGKELANFSQFKSRYCVMGGFGDYQVVGYKHLDELQNKLNSISLRRTKEDVLDLPPKLYIDDYVEMGTKQKKIYNDVLKAIMDDIDNISLSIDPLARLTRLRQATADTSILSSTINESAKIERLKDIVEECVSNNQKVVIFSNWTKVTNAVYEKLKEYNPAIITGEIKNREQEKDKFMNNVDCKIIIGTIGAMGTGLTLTKATTAVFLDEPYTWADKEQAADRIYRIGTKTSVNIITLICKNTIDEFIHRLVNKKRVLGDTIVDKKYNIRDKEVLNYLLTGEGDLQ